MRKKAAWLSGGADNWLRGKVRKSHTKAMSAEKRAKIVRRTVARTTRDLGLMTNKNGTVRYVTPTPKQEMLAAKEIRRRLGEK